MGRVQRAVLVSALGLMSTACATKGYVNEGLAEVNAKVATLTESLEDTQEQTRENAAGVDEAQRQALAAGRSADGANAAAAAADERAAAVGAETDRMKRLLYEVVLSQEQGNFAFGDATLPEGAKMAIDRLAEQLRADPPNNVYIEIEGHTDSTGDAAVNQRIGLERAEAVKRYLHESHGIPLHRMNVISYGEDKPVAPNDTREGRAQNRRVVVRVLS